MKRIGLIVNPVAGMGGSVGLKGTDGTSEEARNRGAVPRSPGRAKITLDHVKKTGDLFFLTCSGAMGEDILKEAGITDYRLVYEYQGQSSAQDTKKAARSMVEQGCDLILFCGGDGTARDIFDVVERRVPLLGIPAGVKMYSAVFAVNPEIAAELTHDDTSIVLRDAEILDVNEDAYRAGELKTRLYGIARVPALPGKTQHAKLVFEEADEEQAKDEIARFMGEVIKPDTLYILGAGTTTEAVARHVGVEKTLLGVDVIQNGTLVARDADEKTLLRLIERENDVRVIVSPIGAQGFIFGRGNQQISAGVLKKIGLSGVIVVATPHKLRDTPLLYIDTGDPILDTAFGDSIQVISGYRIAQRKAIFHHGTCVT